MSEATPTPTPQKPSFWTRLWRFLVRLVFVIILGVVIGAALYWTVPLLYRQYIQPVQVHSIRLDTLDARQKMYEDQVSENLSDFQARLQALEAQQDDVKASIAELQDWQAGIDAAIAGQQAQTESLQNMSEEIAGLQASLEDLQSELEGLQASQRQLGAGLREIQGNQTTQAEAQAELSAQVDELSEVVYQEDARWIAFQRDFQMVKVMELLTHARFYLSQGNTGLAQDDIEAARELLAVLQEEAPEYQAEMITETIAYLDTALEALPDSALQAADSLEGAWQLIIQAIPSEPPVGTPEATPEDTEAPTETPTPTPTT